MIKAITVGVFDLFHLGHLRLLKKAKEYSDYLIVAVHNDKLKIKQVDFVYSLEERIEMIEAVKYVDEVISYERVDLLLPTIDFDIFIYGPDQNHQYFKKAIKWCEENSKKTLCIKRTENISSSKIREILKTSTYHSI